MDIVRCGVGRVGGEVVNFSMLELSGIGGGGGDTEATAAADAVVEGTPPAAPATAKGMPNSFGWGELGHDTYIARKGEHGGEGNTTRFPGAVLYISRQYLAYCT